MRILAGILCDEVRREDNGKLFLIGAYGSQIFVEQIPAVLIFSLLLKVETETPVEIPVEFRVLLNDKEIRTGKGQMVVISEGEGLVVIPGILLDQLTEGPLAFDVRIRDGKWQTVSRSTLIHRTAGR